MLTFLLKKIDALVKSSYTGEDGMVILVHF